MSTFQTREEGLDHIFLQALQDGSSQANAFLGTALRIGLSFEGNRAHNGREVFDIVVMVREPGSGVEKLFVFQTKRLWPDSWQTPPGRLPRALTTLPANARNSIERAWFQLSPRYSDTSAFGAIADPFPPFAVPPREQASAIEDFDSRFWPVYYLFYAPLLVPKCPGLVGARSVRSRTLHGHLRSGGTRALHDILTLPTLAIEDFMAREVLGCREGGPSGSKDWAVLPDLLAGQEFLPRAIVTISSETETGIRPESIY